MNTLLYPSQSNFTQQEVVRALGLKRLWLSHHHSMLMSQTTEILYSCKQVGVMPSYQQSINWNHFGRRSIWLNQLALLLAFGAWWTYLRSPISLKSRWKRWNIISFKYNWMTHLIVQLQKKLLELSSLYPLESLLIQQTPPSLWAPISTAS